MKKIFYLVSCICCLHVFGQTNNEPLKIYEQDSITIASYSFEGFEHFLKQNDGTTYVINFWATWCAPCIKELPYFEKLGKEYEKDKVKVILVSLDFPKKVESSLIPFIKKKKLMSEVIHLDDPDANSWIEKVNKDWSGAIPATIIYKNKLSHFYEQSFTYEELEKELQLIINK
ncbi:redoxin domain-containing protein [Flavobacterium sp. J27]|uniref:redoxin domain-containing protein n=1 Tax=Flavobacterium sp. J27 TaxID=2060419 RepID=UPI001030792A|nr:redoxin domain-containing protein [Flavobacterium sp. J27]